MIEEGDKTFARIHYSGIHYGDFLGYAPTHAHLKWHGAAVFTFRDGKIADLWVLWDIQGLLKQLAQLIQE
jgi:predicted ester cyclase